MPTKTFKFGDGVLDKKPNIYGPVGITVDNSFFDNAAECFLFTKCNLNGCSRMSDIEIAKIKPKIPDVDGNILDSNGKPQHISSGGVKSIIDAIVRIFIKIFGWYQNSFRIIGYIIIWRILMFYQYLPSFCVFSILF